MNRTIKAAGFVMLGLLLGDYAQARWNDSYLDSAKVVKVKPIYESVRVETPRRHCWSERVRHRDAGHSSYTATIAGGIVGGVVGRQFGHGNTRRLLTVAGSLLGASIGNEISRHGRGRGVHRVRERRCEKVTETEWRDQLIGYRVTYRYRGRTFVTRTDKHPGDRIEIKVDLEPALADAVPRGHAGVDDYGRGRRR